MAGEPNESGSFTDVDPTPLDSADPPSETQDQTMPMRPKAAPRPTAHGYAAQIVDATAGAAAARPLPTKEPETRVTEGRYAVTSMLGQGGMGEVVLAFDEQLGRDVAIKRIRTAAPSPDERARFLREARVQGRLEHPAVVPVHDLAVDRDGKPFFVMKRLAGTTMADLMKAQGPGDRRLLRAFVDVCLAVEFAHQHGIVHRDLKPSNVMLGEFGEVYVLDWGIARALGDGDETPGLNQRSSLGDLKLDTGDTAVGTIMGTPAYASPEQLVGDPAGPAADIYALGCILFEIVSGRKLHVDRKPGVLAPTPDARPSHVRSDAPPELDAVCVVATQLVPEDRQPTARALGNAVQAFLDGDRDLAVRRELALGHLKDARDAMARGDSEENRQTAMRSAGRAIALDPTATAAAELMTSLLLTPPTTVPAAVKAAMWEHDFANARAQGRIGAPALAGALVFPPLFVWAGVRDPTAIIAFVVLSFLNVAQIIQLVRGGVFKPNRAYLTNAINAGLLFTLERTCGPFVVVPSLAIAMLVAPASHAKLGRISVLGVMLASGVLVPWFLEVIGVLAPTYHFKDGDLILSSGTMSFTSVPTQIACLVAFVMILFTVANLARHVANNQRASAEDLELRLWHLRQIVPAEPTTAAPSSASHRPPPSPTR